MAGELRAANTVCVPPSHAEDPIPCCSELTGAELSSISDDSAHSDHEFVKSYPSAKAARFEGTWEPPAAEEEPCWSAADSDALYNISAGWGAPYFGVSAEGHLTVRPRAGER